VDDAPVFAALGDRTRLAIVSRLCASGPQSTASLSQGSGVSRQAVTKHLGALENAGIVGSARMGRERIWSLDVARVAEARSWLEQVSAQWDVRLEKLRAMVE
jgi:DNA-binding transcriptional ArsR family regulator